MALVDPLLGQTLADVYVVEELIGEGAMGRVYRARHKTLAGKRYAIKVLIGDMAASSTMRLRFAREAENASKLDHPNVVNVIDYGRSPSGLHYLVMDLVEGPTLSTILRRGPMAAERVIRIAHQLCEGLEHAHTRGVIHRDFKPDNILVVADGSRDIARIADFGLAMKTTAEARLTTTGVACTPAYAAPEQLRGERFDHRVDLYALGATMFEMLSGGHLPFDGEVDSLVRAKLCGDPPSILTRAPNVPPGLVTLLAKLLANDPNERPRSARAVIRALETSLMLPRPKIRTVDMRPLEKPVRRGRGLRTGLALCMLATITFGATQLIDIDRLPVAEARAVVSDAAQAVSEATDVVIVPVISTEASPLATASLELAPPAVVPAEPAATRATTTAAEPPPPAPSPVTPPPVVERKVAAPTPRRVRKPPAPAVAAPAAKVPEVTAAVTPASIEATPAVATVNVDQPPPTEQPEPAAEAPDVEALAQRYSVVGRQLKAAEQGEADVSELRARYDRIQISDAVATPASRAEAAAVLEELERAIADRQRQ